MIDAGLNQPNRSLDAVLGLLVNYKLFIGNRIGL